MMKVVRRNFWWKLLALAIAFALWLAMSGARELTTSVTVPVQYRNIPKNLEISSAIVESAHLVLRGPAALLARVNNRAMPVVIDMGEVLIPGQRTFTLDNQNINLPAGVVLERAIPAQIRLTLEPRLTRTVPVRVHLAHVPEGSLVVSVGSTPDMLTVSGPESKVRAVAEVETDPVDVRALNPNGETHANTFTGDPQVYFSSAAQVRVKVVLKPADGKQ